MALLPPSESAAPACSIDVKVSKEDTHVTVDNANNTDKIGVYVFKSFGIKGEKLFFVK